MDKFYNVYLSGGMQKFGKDDFDKGNVWRRYCKYTLEKYESDYKVKVCNPNDLFNFRDEPQYVSEREVMNLDLHKLRQSDLVIINFNDVYSLGSMSEISIAYDRGIPVIGLNIDAQKLHSWQVCMCERIFDDIDEMLDYVKDFYLG